MHPIPRIARWAVAFCLVLAVVLIGGAYALDRYTEREVRRAASDIGIDLTAKRTSFRVINARNEDGYRGYDVRLFDVTMRDRDGGGVVHASLVELRFGMMDKPRDLSAMVFVEIYGPTIEVEGDLKQLLERARDSKASADVARRRTGGAPISIALRDASVTVRGAAGPGTEARLRFKHLFGDVGEPPARGFDDDLQSSYGGSIAKGDVTWLSGGRSEGPVELDVSHHSRGEASNPEIRYELTALCDTRIVVRLASGFDPTFSSHPRTQLDHGGACPDTRSMLGTLGVREAPPHR